jgi:pimeloyl-ACP methyl ester carboxylesterase
MRYWISALLWFVMVSAARTDGPQDNVPQKVRPVPPPGIAVPADAAAKLNAELAELGKQIEELRTLLKNQPKLLELLPDVEIYHNAVRTALTYNEFFNARELPIAHKLLQQGRERAAQLREGKTPWTSAAGLVVRGYVSRIDGSVQPYGLVVPESYRADTDHKHRLDVWCHGRGETLSELNFLDQRQRQRGEFTPPGAFVLHPYGRYCNANKFAGEVDLFEGLANVRKHYPIDENRLVMRGFSMGGAACWQFAVHFPGMWAAATPGAGFAETPDFLKVFQNEAVKPTWYEEKLWHLYDCTDYAVNLFNCPVIAYSGEIDRQKQAADTMAKALASEGISLVHILGPKTAHAYHPQAKEEIERRLASLVTRGRDPVPPQVRFSTWTLRYHRDLWVQVDGLDKHWERARVDAEMIDRHRVQVYTQNVTALTLTMAPGLCPLDNLRRPKVLLDGQEVEAAPVLSDRSWAAHFRKGDNRWQLTASSDDGMLRKRHGLQGPIDDAFMDSFVMVRPTGKPLHDKVGAWADKEMNHAIEHWRRQFRGDARVKNDDAITEADLAAHNLVLWGDPSSNKVLAKIADKLPLRWDAQAVHVGAKSFPAEHHVPVLIYPNPLNPKRYVVLNSGFTFREYDYLNNARQVPKLPDFAVVDIGVPPSSRAPGGIVEAGFFDEQWQLPAMLK